MNPRLARLTWESVWQQTVGGDVLWTESRKKGESPPLKNRRSSLGTLGGRR